MDIGHAANALRVGKRVARDDWPAHQWLVLVPGSTFPVTADRPMGIAAPEMVGEQVRYEPHVDQARGNKLAPYTWTGDDVLATDWRIV